MTKAQIAKVSWAVLTLSLAALFLLSSLATWPAVLQNSAARLGWIAYVIACPMLPLFWRGRRLALILSAAGAVLLLQILAFGTLNYWF
jgi:hypothetical protein